MDVHVLVGVVDCLTIQTGERGGDLVGQSQLLWLSHSHSDVGTRSLLRASNCAATIFGIGQEHLWSLASFLRWNSPLNL